MPSNAIPAALPAPNMPAAVAGHAQPGQGEQQLEASASHRAVPLQMGCHGIGISRLIAAIAGHLNDERGLNWPPAIAPYEVAVLAKQGLEEAALEVYDLLASASVATADAVSHGSVTGAQQTQRTMDVVLDDRDAGLVRRLVDADLVGYPVLVVLGTAWGQGWRECEVQCRQLQVKTQVKLEELPSFIRDLLDRLTRR